MKRATKNNILAAFLLKKNKKRKTENEKYRRKNTNGR
mgnify:CR=1 FL=1